MDEKSAAMRILNLIQNILDESNALGFHISILSKSLDDDYIPESEKIELLPRIIELLAEYDEMMRVLKIYIEVYLEKEKEENLPVNIRIRQIYKTLAKA